MSRCGGGVVWESVVEVWGQAVWWVWYGHLVAAWRGSGEAVCGVMSVVAMCGVESAVRRGGSGSGVESVVVVVAVVWCMWCGVLCGGGGGGECGGGVVARKDLVSEERVVRRTVQKEGTMTRYTIHDTRCTIGNHLDSSKRVWARGGHVVYALHENALVLFAAFLALVGECAGTGCKKSGSQDKVKRLKNRSVP